MVAHRVLSMFLAALVFLLAPQIPAQEAQPDAPAVEQPTATTSDRSSTGGAQTLEDILARQRGEKVDDSFRRDATGNTDRAASISNQLGTLGGVSDAEMFRALRYGTADVTASNDSPGATQLVQDSGMQWLLFRDGPLRQWGGYGILGMLVVLVLFFLLRGRIRIEGGRSGITILRFNAIERFSHWLLAGSFILLGITGLITLFGRTYLIPVFGKDAFATLAVTSKWIHNNVSWAFMVSLVMIFVLWIIHNLPSKHDLVWLSKGGGLFTKHSHPPAKKFNAGQKLIFWSVVLLGASVSASGLSLLFPFELPMFAKTFAAINALGLPGFFGQEPLPTVLTPHAEMQLAQIWHAIIAFVMIIIIVAHIYLGSIGMEGAYEAMGTGEVDLQWAKDHHSLWVEEVQARNEIPPEGHRQPAE